MRARITAPATARRWRRKRRQASAHGEWLRARRFGAAPAPLAVRDPGVEPAIEDVGEQVEEDDQAREHEGHRHDHRRVVGEDRADQERADAGTRKICSVTIAPPNTSGICSATSVTTGMSALRTTCFTITTGSARPFERAVVTESSRLTSSI